MTIDRIHPPWSPDQVDALNRFQRAGVAHPFTCAEHHGGADRTLVATVDGWICPHCQYRQMWAHASMLEAPVDPCAELRAELLRGRVEKILAPAIDPAAPYAKVMIGEIVKLAMPEAPS